MTTLLTPKEAAGLLHISLSTLYRLKDRGCLPFYTIGSGIRFAIADLECFLAESRTDLTGGKNYALTKNTKQVAY